jgi:hypothetical protein
VSRFGRCRRDDLTVGGAIGFLEEYRLTGAADGAVGPTAFAARAAVFD